MPIGREHVNIYLGIEDLVYHTMFLRDSAAPLSVAIPLQLLWMSCTGLWMLFQFLNELIGLFVGRRLGTLQFPKVFNRLGRISYTSAYSFEKFIQRLIGQHLNTFTSFNLFSCLIYTGKELLFAEKGWV